MDGSASDRSARPLGATARNTWHVTAQSVDTIRPHISPRPVVLHDSGREVTVDLARTALVIVDMQNDFCHPDGWLGHVGVDVTPVRAPIGPLQRILPVLRAAGVPVIWLNWGNRPDRMNLPPAVLHVYDPDGRSAGIGHELPGTGAKVLERGSWSAEIVDELAPEQGDIHVSKYRMSGFHDTELDSILRNLRVDGLLFAGVNVDQCVLCTLQDANFRGYDCILLEDCAATTSPDYCREATLYNIRQCFGFVADGAMLARALKEDA